MLTLVHFSPQPELVLSTEPTETTQRNPREVLMVSRKRGGMCRPWEAVAEERRLGFSHSHNDEFNWDAFHAWQVKNDGA